LVIELSFLISPEGLPGKLRSNDVETGEGTLGRYIIIHINGLKKFPIVPRMPSVETRQPFYHVSGIYAIKPVRRRYQLPVATPLSIFPIPIKRVRISYPIYIISDRFIAHGLIKNIANSQLQPYPIFVFLQQLIR
jgi:hypothetical protein